MWDVDFVFEPDEAVAFMLWGTQKLNNWIDQFEMPIRTEFGNLVHTCRFLPESLLPTTEAGPLWKYSAKLLARAKIIPQEFKDSTELIIGLPNWGNWASQLDETVNEAQPEA